MFTPMSPMTEIVRIYNESHPIVSETNTNSKPRKTFAALRAAMHIRRPAKREPHQLVLP